MKRPHVKTIRTKFLLPILLFQFIALGALGFLGYRFSSDLLKSRSEQEFKTTIEDVYAAIDNELTSRLAKIEQLIADPIFIKFSAAAYYKSDADAQIFNFQKGAGLILGEPKIGGLVNYPVGLIANEGNREVVETGLFPSVEYAGADGQVKLHVYLGGSNEKDFELEDKTRLDRSHEEWFKEAIAGNIYAGRPEMMKLYQREYQPITFENIEVPVEKELIPIAVPHRIGNAIRGVFLVTTTPDMITDAMRKVSAGLLLMVLDKNGAIIAESGDKTIIPDPSGDFLKGAASTNPDAIVDYEDRILLHRTIPMANWPVFMIGDRNAIYGSVFKFRNDVLAIMAVSLAAISAIVFMIIGRLVRPVLNLTKASGRIAKGELGLVIAKESDDEIGRLTDSFNQMSVSTKEMHDRVSRMNYIRRQLLNIISHELRTPLNSVVGFYDLLEMDLEDGMPPPDLDGFESDFKSLGVSIEKCKELIERLTRVSSVMAKQIRSGDEEAEVAILNDAICAACEQMRSNAKPRNIEIKYPADISVTLACPMNAARLILEEALSNAVKYSPDGAVVEVEVATDEKMAHIKVKDKGQGIPKEYLNDVVEPFFEVEDSIYHSTGRFGKGAGGLGLGLTIILSVLKQYHGLLHFDPAEGGGTVVTMSLPLA